MSSKASLDFILNPVQPQVVALLELQHAVAAFASAVAVNNPLTPTRVDASAPHADQCHPVRVEEKRFVAIRPKMEVTFNKTLSPASSSDADSIASDEEFTTSSHTATYSKKKTRLCKEPGCTSLAVSRRSCVRHGGGSRCVVDGCTNGARLRNKCFQHGGSTVCLADGCESKAKRYGYCWCHGGGRICSVEDCNKVAAQGGMCWAHGGGNRCKLEGCIKRSYQKHGYYCKRHAMYNTA